MLKWSGDFTLPRFRAKLANKHLLHPEVEPGYDEVYRQDLGSSTVIKRSGSAGGFSMGSTRPSGRGLADLVDTMSFSSGCMSRTYSSGFGDRGRSERFGRSGGFDGGMSTASAGSDGLPRLSLSSSTPSLGVRRADVAPMRMASSLSGSSLVGGVPPSPANGDGDGKRDLPTELASRRLWMAAHGSNQGIAEHLQACKDEDPDAKNWIKSIKDAPAPGMVRALKGGAKLDWRNPDWDGSTLFLKSVRAGDIAMVMYLLSQGADAAVIDGSGRNALHWAAMEGNTVMMETLLFYTPAGLNPNQADGGGDTALHIAAYGGYLSSMRLLVAIKADPQAINGNGYSAMELGEARRMWHVSHYLGENKQQEEDKANESAKIADFDRPCNLFRSAELAELQILNPKPKPKAKGKAKAKK